MKLCTGCNIEKPLDAFGMKRGKKNSRCKQCFNDYYRNYWKQTEAYEKHKARVNAKRDVPGNRAKKYGLSVEEMNVWLTKNDGLCELCNVNKATAIDHCHETGKVRGILCTKCNTGLGKLGDSVFSLKRALAYLERAAEA